MTDSELLRRYALDHSEAAFEELVGRHINLVYSAALRQVCYDAGSAQDVTQRVFIDLARKAVHLTGHSSLAAWLYTSTRFAAATCLRSERRRRFRELEAHAMNALLQSPQPGPDWAQIGPVLDDAMHSLGKSDRMAVVERHFNQRSYSEIGTMLGLSENSARMRVERALDKLRLALSRRGITSTAQAVAAVLAANAVAAAPVGVCSTVAKQAVAATADGAGAWTFITSLVAYTRFKISVVAITVAVAVIWSSTLHHRSTALSAGEHSASPATGVTSNPVANGDSIEPVGPTSAVELSVQRGISTLHLEIVASDSGKPVPNVPIDYRAESAGGPTEMRLQTDRMGHCLVEYPTNSTNLELTTRIEDFADTHLVWSPAVGDVIPTNYILRLDRPVGIGGSVIDSDGRPVQGATVEWFYQDDPAGLKLPQNHEFGRILVSSDLQGRWQLNRIAPDMFWRLGGIVEHTNFLRVMPVVVGNDKLAERQLKAGEYVFRLKRGLSIAGIVTDEFGTPVADAHVFGGFGNPQDRRDMKTLPDGTFTLQNCEGGAVYLSVEAQGYSTTTIRCDPATNSGAVQLVLRPGNILRVRVTDGLGAAISNATVSVNGEPGSPFDRPDLVPVQARWSSHTDSEGHAMWTNAPDAELLMSVLAPGFKDVHWITVRPGATDHLVTLDRSVVVRGTVTDGATGKLIPKFQVIAGWPTGPEGSTNIEWSKYGRDWMRFQGGHYQQSLQPLVTGTPDPGYALKFQADGYSPFVSRVIRPDEVDVTIDAQLTPAAGTAITVYDPDGRVEPNADIGLVFPGAHLDLMPSGISGLNVMSGGALLHTDSNGRFQLQHDDATTRVVAAAASGFAEARPGELFDKPYLYLQPWGRLEVTCMSGGSPVVGREYVPEFGGGSYETISFDFGAFRRRTDDRGHIFFNTLPPGRHHLMRIYEQPAGNAWGPVWKTIPGSGPEFEIKPGETTSLTLGASSYTVKARLAWPAELERKPGWRVQAMLQRIPNVKANDSSTQQPQMSFCTVTGDNLQAEEVEAGSYVLAAFVTEFTNTPSGGRIGKQVIGGDVSVQVPENPPSGVLDAGVVQMKTP